MKNKSLSFASGMLFAYATMIGCASIYPYRYYATEMKSECYDNGKLLGKLGKDGWPDAALTECKPDPEPSPGASPGVNPVRLKCIVTKVDDFYTMKADYLKCHKDLQICQQGNPPQ